MPLSPVGSTKSKSSFRGPLELDYVRSADRTTRVADTGGYQIASTSAIGLNERTPETQKASPSVTSAQHLMPWELYEEASPPPLPSPSHTILTYSSAPSESSARPSNQRQTSSEAMQSASGFYLTAANPDLAGAPASPHSAGSGSTPSSATPSSHNIAQGEAVTTPPSAVRSPGGSSGGGFFASFRPSSPRIIVPKDDTASSLPGRRDKERSHSASGDKGNNDTSHIRPPKESKGLEKGRRPSSVFDHVGTVLERFKKAHHHRSESREGRPSVSSIPSAEESQALHNSSEDRTASRDAVEYLDSPVNSGKPILSRNYSSSSAVSITSHDDANAAPRKVTPRSSNLDRILIQVTEDNERFAVVDISGLTTAAGIKERMLSKLHRFDEESCAYEVIRTEIGVSEASGPALADQTLLSLCLGSGDDKGNLKFLMRQSGGPLQSAHAVPPPTRSPHIKKASLDPDNGSGSPRSPLAGQSTSSQWRQSSRAGLHAKSGSVSSLSSISDALASVEAAHSFAQDSGSESSRKVSGLSRAKNVRRSGGGQTSGDESHRSSLASSAGPSRPGSTRPANHDRRSPSRERSRAVSGEDSATESGTLRPRLNTSSHTNLRSNDTAPAATSAADSPFGPSSKPAGGRTQQELTEEMEELRNGSVDDKFGGQPNVRFARGSSRRPATSQGVNVPQSSHEAIGVGTGGERHSRRTSEVGGTRPGLQEISARTPSHLDAHLIENNTAGTNSQTPQSMGMPGNAFGKSPPPDRRGNGGILGAHDSPTPLTDLRGRRGSDVGPQTQRQQQQADILPTLTQELNARGRDTRYPNSAVPRQSNPPGAAANSPPSNHSIHSRHPIDFESINARHAQMYGPSYPHASSSVASSSLPYLGDASALRSPPLPHQPHQIHHVSSFSHANASSTSSGPLHMRSTTSSDGYVPAPHYHAGIGPRQQPDAYGMTGPYTRSPANYANEFGGMRVQSVNGYGHVGQNSPFPFPQRPHTYHDAGVSPYVRPIPPRQIDLPENPYTRALFPASSSRQVSEFQRSGQLGASALSPGMTVQESLQHNQRQQQQPQNHSNQHHSHPSHPHFGPREPRQQAHNGPWPAHSQHRSALSPTMAQGSHDPRFAHQGQQLQSRMAPPPPRIVAGTASQTLSQTSSPLPASIPLGFHQGASKHQQIYSTKEIVPSSHTAASDRSSTSSYVSSAEGSDSRRPSSGSYRLQRDSVDEHTTAPTSARSSRSDPPSSPERSRQRAASVTSSSKQSGDTHDKGSGQHDEEDEDEMDLSKIRPLPTLPVANAAMEVSTSQSSSNDEGTLKAGNIAATLSQGGRGAGDDGNGTLRQSKSPASNAGSSSASTVTGGAETRPSTRSSAGHDLGSGTFASFGSFDDDDDDNEGGTWAKPLDDITPAPTSTTTPAPSSVRDDGTIRPMLRGLSPSGQAGDSSRVSSPRRPELRLTIDPPRAAPFGSANRVASPLRAVPSPSGSGSPRLAELSTLTPTGVYRSSSFARRGDNEWALRPPPEELYENLDEFFPRHDLDKPVLDAVGTPGPAAAAAAAAAAGGGGVSPGGAGSTTVKAAQSTTETAKANADTSRLASNLSSFANALSRNKKSIRRVAQDRMKTLEKADRRLSSSSSMLASSTDLGALTPTSSSPLAVSSADGHLSGYATVMANANLVRKRSTRLWGTKLLEMTPSGAEHASNVPLSTIAGGSSPSSSSSGGRPVFKWVKGDLIGKGTYGRVYIALNATTGEMIAVKQVELPTTESDRQDKRQRDVVNALKSEIQTLKDLDHPHIVSYLGFEETPEYLHLFLEYVPGGSIASVLRKYGKLEESIIKSFVRQVLSGLSYLHESGVLHRDLKGDNLLVNLDGTVKISDFGTMRRSEDIYTDKEGMSLQGSVFWMAPEMVRSVNGYSAKVDIWSLGCLTLEMFAGRRPWSDDEALQAMFKIGMERRAPPIPPDVRLSPEADHFLRVCFLLDPVKRPTAARLLDHVFPDVPADWSFEESRLYRMMQRSLQNRAGVGGGK